MKRSIFKYLTFLVVGIMLLFFMMGLVYPTIDYKSEISVQGSVVEVFKSFNKLEEISNWIPEITQVDTIRITPDLMGSKFDMTIENNGQESVMQETVLAYEQNKLVSLSIDVGPMIKVDEYSFSQEGTETRIKGSHQMEGTNYFYKCMFGFFKKSSQQIDQEFFQKFKNYFENK